MRTHTWACFCVLRARSVFCPPTAPLWVCVAPALYTTQEHNYNKKTHENGLNWIIQIQGYTSNDYKERRQKQSDSLMGMCGGAPLWEQPIRGQVAGLVHVFVVISVFGLNSVGGQQNSCLWRTVVLIIQNSLFYLHTHESHLNGNFKPCTHEGAFYSTTVPAERRVFVWSPGWVPLKHPLGRTLPWT